MDWNKKTILLTGGTGSFGNKFTQIMLKEYAPKALRIFSRDELKQWEMEKRFRDDKRLRFLIGDVRDKERVERAMDGADIVVHAAALKQVPLCEYNPLEAIKTNILGAQNIIEAAIDHDIAKVLAISSDKAVSPVNLYGATKMCMEKLFIAANAYVGAGRHTIMSCVRYGNVVGSRGSVIPVFKEQIRSGILTVTDERMTRFWITLEQSARFVIRCVEMMHGGEIFVPKIPSMKIVDVARAMAPKCALKKTGIRAGEKLHEFLLTEDEARHASEFKDFFIIAPDRPWWRRPKIKGGRPVQEQFRYASDTNDQWVTGKQLLGLIREA